MHARDVGLAGAPDPVVLDRAVAEERVLITLDTDFAALIAHSAARLPSVVLFRGSVTRRPANQVGLLLANLPQFAADLEAGAVVVIGDDRIRVRAQPM